ncbi:hypothetical protein BGX20_008264 [Mortierella sp. AD010]|nr:hypothetical protein BGX20_008264 [Mortierella sp. AD010]
MERASQPDQTIPTPPSSTRASASAKRVSFESDTPTANVHQSSLPSSTTPFAYSPFSAFDDDVAEESAVIESQTLNGKFGQGYEHRALKNDVLQETQLLLSKCPKDPTVTPGRPVSALAAHPRAKRSSMTVSREQRRHSADGQSQPGQGFVIPTKCRMVFHMRDEVSKGKGPSGEEDKTGLSEKRGGCTPQQQPRQYQRPAPLKKTGSNKCAKRVSFKEPEPWREACAEEPEEVASVAAEAIESLAVLPVESDSTISTASATKLTPAIDSLVRSSSVPSKALNSPPSTPPTNKPQRNMSTPPSSAFDAPSAGSNILNNKEGSQSQKGTKSASGNRFSRLWKNVSQKFKLSVSIFGAKIPPILSSLIFKCTGIVPNSSDPLSPTSLPVLKFKLSDMTLRLNVVSSARPRSFSNCFFVISMGWDACPSVEARDSSIGSNVKKRELKCGGVAGAPAQKEGVQALVSQSL